jgi:hypothetical protein
MMRSIQILQLVLFLLVIPILARGQQATSDHKITGQFVNASVADFAARVEAQTGFKIYFDAAAFDTLRLNFNADQTPLSVILDTHFSGPVFFHAVDNHNHIFLTTTEIQTPLAPKQVRTGVDRNNEVEDTNDITAFREHKVYEIGTKGSNPKEAILSGYVKMTDSREPVVDASVRIQGSSVATSTDNSGYYSLRLVPGRYVITFTNVGLKTTRRNVLIHNNGTLNLEMQPEVTRLQEVVVQSDRTSNTAGLQMGANKLNIQTLKLVPSTFGETDVLKAILTLPGVKTVGEASTGFNVRGGAADQNLILLDGSTIYNPFHFFGFFSSFNPQAIENVELFKGSVPSAHGGRLSSVIKITSREGDKEQFKGSAGIGLLTGRINIEGPIIKNKASFSAGARKTYSNWVFDLLPKSSGYSDTKGAFHDVNLTLDADMGERNKLRFSGYVSHDESNLNTDTTYSYSNQNFSLRWDHDFNDAFRLITTISKDHFDYGNSSDADPTLAYRLKFAIDQTALKTEFIYELNSAHTFNFGLSSIHYKLNPGTYTQQGDQSLIIPVKIRTEQGLETAVHLEDVMELTPKLSVNAGIRYSVFNYLGEQTVNYYVPGLPRSEENWVGSKDYKSGELVNSYHGPEARLSARYLIGENFSIKTGYTVMRQYIHMLSNTVAISPTDIWKLSDPNIKPQLSEQFSLGLYKNFSTTLETSVEGYWKTIKNYLDYKSGAVLVLNPAIEQDVVSTRGKAYGVEALIKKTKGNFNGWVSYTWSRTLLIADDPIAGEKINKGEYYPASYDKPHDFNFTGNQKLSKRFNFSLNMNYSTGRPVTIPIGVFSYGGSPKTLYSSRNGYRIPDYFRMDISLNLEGNHKLKQRFHNSWTFGVYNLTGRKNPYSVYYTQSGNVIKGYKISVFGSAIPFVNFNIRF